MTILLLQNLAEILFKTSETSKKAILEEIITKDIFQNIEMNLVEDNKGINDFGKEILKKFQGIF